MAYVVVWIQGVSTRPGITEPNRATIYSRWMPVVESRGVIRVIRLIVYTVLTPALPISQQPPA